MEYEAVTFKSNSKVGFAALIVIGYWTTWKFTLLATSEA